jgi:hypothetical protein
MSTKHYAIYDPATGLYSKGYSHYTQGWGTVDQTRLFNEVGHARSHINLCNKQAASYKIASMPYTSGMEIVEVECQYTNKGLVEKV